MRVSLDIWCLNFLWLIIILPYCTYQNTSNCSFLVPEQSHARCWCSYLLRTSWHLLTARTWNWQHPGARHALSFCWGRDTSRRCNSKFRCRKSPIGSSRLPWASTHRWAPPSARRPRALASVLCRPQWVLWKAQQHSDLPEIMPRIEFSMFCSCYGHIMVMLSFSDAVHCCAFGILWPEEHALRIQHPSHEWRLRRAPQGEAHGVHGCWEAGAPMDPREWAQPGIPLAVSIVMGVQLGKSHL